MFRENPIHIIILGAVNGLLVGLLLEELRVHYVLTQLLDARRDFQEHHNWATDVFVPSREALVPLLCTLAFAASSGCVYLIFRKRPQWLLWTWMILAIVALWAGYFMSTLAPNAFSFLWLFAVGIISYLTHRFWKHYLRSQFLLWLVIGISSVLFMAFGAQLVGVLFYWPELRNPFTWLFFLIIVMIVNSIYGGLMEFSFRRHRF